MFSVGDYVQHKYGFRGYIVDIISEYSIALKRDDGIVGVQYHGCYTVGPGNLTLIPDPLENE